MSAPSSPDPALPRASAKLPLLAAADTRGRPLHDLRVSVTDRCNFRCSYCMPRDRFENHRFLPRADLLSFEEITRSARLLTELGLRKVRLTGGEPLLRAELPQLVSQLAKLPGLDLALTTNGSLLAAQARPLRDAGLARLTVSLDAIDPVVFHAMTDAGLHVDSVLDGIRAAAAAGFPTIKVNTVVRRGLNDQQIIPLARHFQGSGHILRFIEYMDVGLTNGWRLDQVLSGKEIVERIDRVLPLEPLDANYTGEVARRYRYRDGSGEIGIITSVSQPFCGDCSRLRLSSDGQLYTCLFARSGHDLRALLRSQRSDPEITSWLHDLWRTRADRYSEQRSENTRGLTRAEMSYIGG